MAASRYGFLFMNKIEELKKVADQNSIDKQKMKIDHLVVATALAHRANYIYSHDIRIKTFGQKNIDVKELPHLPFEQKTLFNEVEHPF